MCILPHLPFICLQQECSAAVICDPGIAHSIAGMSNDKTAATATMMRRKPDIFFQGTRFPWRRLQTPSLEPNLRAVACSTELKGTLRAS